MAKKLNKNILKTIIDSDDGSLTNEVALELILDNPNWLMAGSVKDWRNYVSIELREQWDKFSINERALVYHYSKLLTHNE